MDQNNQFMQNFQMFLQQNQGMGMNPMMIGANSMMMGNQGMMGMNPAMFGSNNIDPNYIRNMLVNMGYNEMLVNNFLNMYFPNSQHNQQTNTNNAEYKNLVFIQKTSLNKYIIHATDSETLGSVINKYINKSGDVNVNIYIYNSKKINESLTVAEAGLIDYAQIDVVSVDDVEGAYII